MGFYDTLTTYATPIYAGMT